MGPPVRAGDERERDERQGGREKEGISREKEGKRKFDERD